MGAAGRLCGSTLRVRRRDCLATPPPETSLVFAPGHAPARGQPRPHPLARPGT